MGQQASRKARAPLHLGRYEILVPLASGGMGTVYIGAVRGAGGFEREVAIKLIHDHLREEEQFTAELLEEAKLAVRIRHPNVVGVLDAGEEPEGVYLVMDYVEGDSLAGLMRRMRKVNRAIPAVVGLRILHDALLGLHAAHELEIDGEPAGLVHRDFTPHNILVGTDGIARLTDFGVAKAATRNSHTATGIVKGKLHYMPPEQAKAEPIDRRADIWSAGVIAWELLARRRLFVDLNDAAIVLQLVSSAPPPLRSVRDTIPVALEQAVKKALAPAEERYRSAQAFARDLEAAAGQLGGLANAERVATFVQEATREKLDKRAEQIEKVRSLRDSLDSLTEAEKEIPDTPSDFGPAQTWSAKDAALVADEPTSGVAQSPMSLTPAPTVKPRPGRRRPVLLGVAVVALLVGGGAAAWLTSNRPSESEPAPLAKAPAKPPAPVAPKVEPPPTPPPEVTGAPKPASRRVTLRSPVAIAKVLAGEDALPIEPGHEVSLDLGVEVEAVTVVTASGLRKRVEVTNENEIVEVSFPVARRPGSHKKPPPPPPRDGLAPNPFDD